MRRRALLLSAISIVFPAACAGHRAPSSAPGATVATSPATVAPAAPAPATIEAATPEPAATAAAEPDVFRARIAPLLAQKCAPCHNPGGKMYATMPFDDPATITAHAEGVLKRIKTPEEHALIEQWIASRPKSGAGS